jgi:hypothetical protein
MLTKKSLQDDVGQISWWKYGKNLKIRDLFYMVPIVALLVMGLPADNAGCWSISKAEIEECEVNEMGLDCDEKSVITFPVTFGEEVNLEALAIKQISKNGEPQTIEETFTISTTKSRPRIRYPLIYRHTVAYFPYEDAICAENGACVDAPAAENPTCGWTYIGSQKIEDSQGFCCGKTARCLRQGEVYFHGYEIGRSGKFFDIEVEVVKGEQTHNFTLTPANRLYSARDDENYNGDLKIKAELEGELAGYGGVPELDNYILYVPAGPEDHPFVIDYQHNLLLVPREEVSLDGSQCDKVGVSFHTFRSQEANCNTREIGDCLHNQLFHKHNSDLQKLISNPDAETTYLVHGMKNFKGSMTFKAGMEKVLEFRPAASDEKSLVSITVDLETVKVIKTESIGAIIEAYVKPFESMSGNGTLVANIGNFGDLKSDYMVSVTDCNMNINPAIPQQSQTLEPYQGIELSFDIYTAYNLDTSNECLVTLKSTTGRIYDKTVVKFDTKKHQSRYAWELQQKNEAGDEPVCRLPGDLDGNGIVDRHDFKVIMRHRNKPAAECTGCDIDGDSTITKLDAFKLLKMCTYPHCKSQ